MHTYRAKKFCSLTKWTNIIYAHIIRMEATCLSFLFLSSCVAFDFRQRLRYWELANIIPMYYLYSMVACFIWYFNRLSYQSISGGWLNYCRFYLHYNICLYIQINRIKSHGINSFDYYFFLFCLGCCWHRWLLLLFLYVCRGMCIEILCVCHFFFCNFLSLGWAFFLSISISTPLISSPANHWTHSIAKTKYDARIQPPTKHKNKIWKCTLHIGDIWCICDRRYVFCIQNNV